MVNIIAKPTWQWAGKNPLPRSPSARTSNLGTSPIKQALMPRSLDLNFSLKYRR